MTFFGLLRITIEVVRWFMLCRISPLVSWQQLQLPTTSGSLGGLKTFKFRRPKVDLTNCIKRGKLPPLRAREAGAKPRYQFGSQGADEGPHRNRWQSHEKDKRCLTSN